MKQRTYRIVDGIRMEVPEWWDALTPEELARCCNGVGPDDWPAWRRRWIGRLAPWMEPASKPHDVRYARPMTAGERAEADGELLRNWRRCVKAKVRWRWYDWLIPGRRLERTGRMIVAKLAYETVRLAGAKFAAKAAGKAQQA